jgi:DNA-binding NarL/FixJ family response regulator
MITIAVICKYQNDRITIAALLEGQDNKDFRVISIGSDGYDALNSATTQHPDIIIMDFNMEYIDSLELAPIIKRKSLSTALIVLCSHVEQNAVVKSLRAGISGYLLRQDIFNYLVPSINSVMQGGLYISKSVRDMAPDYFSPPQQILPPELDISPYLFTPTETAILNGILQGHTDREIAKSLNINIGSLRNCISRVKEKTGLRNRTQITFYFLQENSYRHTIN